MGRAWWAEEEEALRAAVQRYGVGAWEVRAAPAPRTHCPHMPNRPILCRSQAPRRAGACAPVRARARTRRNYAVLDRPARRSASPPAPAC